MTSEAQLRLATVFIVVLTMCIAVPHRWRARTRERISRREEGLIFAVVLRLAGFGLWLCLLAHLWLPAAVHFAVLPIPVWLRWCGVAAALGCDVLLYWTLSSLGKNLTDTVVTRKEAYLVTDGPYRWVRHPFYVCAALLIASMTVITANGLLGMYGVTVLLLLAMRTPLEERMLLKRFGDDYRRYMETTGRYIPRVFGK